MILVWLRALHSLGFVDSVGREKEIQAINSTVVILLPNSFLHIIAEKPLEIC